MWCKAKVIVLLLLKINLVSNLSIAEEFNYEKLFWKKLDSIVQDESNGISNNCKRHIKYYKNGLETHQAWAANMFDAASKIPSGVMAGNTADLGSFDQCIEVNHKLNSSEYIKGRYCFGLMNLDLSAIKSVNTSLQLQLASCLPHSCSIEESAIIYRYFNINATFTKNLCQTSMNQPSFGVAEFCGIAFFVALALIMIYSTIYEIYLEQFQIQTTNPILVAFSIVRNGKKLIARENNNRQMSCINGILVISTIWVILIHRYSVQFSFPLRNNFYKGTWPKDARNMFMINAVMSVDTFFLLSGILLSYVYLWSVEKKKPFEICKFYLHRYLRLTPVLVAVIIFVVTLLKRFGSGPLWISTINSDLVESCKTSWWRTLLYINNYDIKSGICIPQGWYLSADMQLFIISPIFLLSLSRWPNRTIFGITALIICNVVGCFLIGWFLEINAILYGNTSMEQRMLFVEHYYFPTHTRAAPWLIGVIVGNYLYLSKKKKYKLSIKHFATIWIGSIVVILLILFGGHKVITTHNKILNSVHLALVRPAWSLAVSGIIFACVNDAGGPVNWFLSLPLFEVLSRLSYTIFTIHYYVICIITGKMRSTMVFQNLEAMYQLWGDFGFSLLGGVFLSLAIELPVIELETILFKEKKTQSKRS